MFLQKSKVELLSLLSTNDKHGFSLRLKYYRHEAFDENGKLIDRYYSYELYCNQNFERYDIESENSVNPISTNKLYRHFLYWQETLNCTMS